jgi:hypothetical protein
MKTLIAVDYLGVSSAIFIRFSFLIPSYSHTFCINPHVPRHFRVSGTDFEVYLNDAVSSFCYSVFLSFSTKPKRVVLKTELVAWEIFLH